MKTDLEILEKKLDALSEKIYLLRTQDYVLVRFKFHDQVTLELQEILALAEKIESMEAVS